MWRWPGALWSSGKRRGPRPNPGAVQGLEKKALQPKRLCRRQCWERLRTGWGVESALRKGGKKPCPMKKTIRALKRTNIHTTE